MFKYETTIYWSSSDECFIAEIPELPGCMAHGDSSEMALRNLQEAAQLWIETAKECGEVIPEPRDHRLLQA